MAVQNDFSKGSILSHMARIALPMTLAQFVNILYNIIDRVFIGRIPDHATEALTGLGVAFPICTLAIAFANLVGMGGAPLFVCAPWARSNGCKSRTCPDSGKCIAEQQGCPL